MPDHQVGVRPGASHGPKLWIDDDVPGMPPVLHVVAMAGSGWSIFTGVAEEIYRLAVDELFRDEPTARETGAYLPGGYKWGSDTVGAAGDDGALGARV